MNSRSDTDPALRALEVFATCPVCGQIEKVEMRDGWQAAVEAGAAIPIIGCGNPWHYALAAEAAPLDVLRDAATDVLLAYDKTGWPEAALRSPDTETAG